jgi:predicted DNA-binding protein
MADNIFQRVGTVNITQQYQQSLNMESYSEAVTIRLTPSQKQKIHNLAKKYGYTDRSIFLRDVIQIGIQVMPFLNSTVKDLIKIP